MIVLFKNRMAWRLANPSQVSKKEISSTATKSPVETQASAKRAPSFIRVWENLLTRHVELILPKYDRF